MFVKTCSNQRHEPLACRWRQRTRAHIPGVARTTRSVARNSARSSGWTISPPRPESQSSSGWPSSRSCDGDRYVILPARSMIVSRSKPLCTSQRKRSSLSRNANSACLRSVMSRKCPTSPRTLGSARRFSATTSVQTQPPSGRLIRAWVMLGSSGCSNSRVRCSPKLARSSGWMRCKPSVPRRSEALQPVTSSIAPVAKMTVPPSSAITITSRERLTTENKKSCNEWNASGWPMSEWRVSRARAGSARLGIVTAVSTAASTQGLSPMSA